MEVQQTSKSQFIGHGDQRMNLSNYGVNVYLYREIICRTLHKKSQLERDYGIMMN